jgi:hypothetical protein
MQWLLQSLFLFREVVLRSSFIVLVVMMGLGE